MNFPSLRPHISIIYFVKKTKNTRDYRPYNKLYCMSLCWCQTQHYTLQDMKKKQSFIFT